MIGNDRIPAIPEVLTLPLELQPMSCLRDSLCMHVNALPERVIRDHIEERPKNVSFSEDNGYWLPIGSRIDVKVYPRDSAVHTDHRHNWSRKWSWALYPVANVPGTWHWMAIEVSVAPGHIHFFTVPEDRPILFFVYICPTVWYKGAQRASSVNHEQTGRKHLPSCRCPCLTCESNDPPRERPCSPPFTCKTGRHSHSYDCSCPTCCFTDTRETSLSEKPLAPMLMHRYSSGSEPSQPATSTPVGRQNLCMRLLAWDKSERLGEALNPGPEPPREIWLRRRNGQRDPLRLCTQNGGWVWNIHCAPTPSGQTTHPPRSSSDLPLSPTVLRLPGS